MDKVVKTGLKFDLHIHSAASAHKDGAKVKNNTLENIGIIIQKLNDNGVNLCAITDHDTFSYAMYHGLKAAESMDNSIQKVLPGVEFSVCFANEGKESVIHVVTIFTDENEAKLKKLEHILQNNRKSIFRIDGQTLKFVSLEFYNGVYAGNKSTSIDFENRITEKMLIH